jgi:hypothetical protein
MALVLAALASPALACDPRDDSHSRDLVRAQEKQADSLRQIERLERDRNKMIDREIRNRR